MASNGQPWQLLVDEVMSDMDELATVFSSKFEQKEAIPDGDNGLASHIIFSHKDAHFSCTCGAPVALYCTCFSGTLEFTPESHCLQQTHSHGDANDPESFIAPPEPRICEDSRATVPTRKERRRQQNRAAQVRHRDKRNRFLHETLRNLEALNEELKQTKAQRDYFRTMYESLENQMVEIRSRSSSRYTSTSPLG